jgi:predicted transcriptional regulator
LTKIVSELLPTVLIELLEAPNSRLTITLESGEKFEAVDTDAFRALLKIREQAEPKGIKFLFKETGRIVGLLE